MSKEEKIKLICSGCFYQGKCHLVKEKCMFVIQELKEKINKKGK